MLPILFSIGSVHVASFSVFLVLSWFVFSFLFWRYLRNLAIGDLQIFDLSFYGTLVALVSSRLAFVAFHSELFTDSLLKIPAIWVQPGFTLYGGMTGGLLTLLYLSRRYKVRAAYILDALAFVLPPTLIVGEIGSVLDGTVVGKLTNGEFGLWYAGSAGPRHPIQIYESFVLLVILIAVSFIHKKAMKMGWPYGTTGLWFFFIYCILMFSVEYFKESSVYFSYLTANQCVLIAYFGEALGAYYVRGGGKEGLRPGISKWKERVGKVSNKIYAKFPNGNASSDQKTS